MDLDAEDTVQKTREAAEQSKALDKVTDHVRVCTLLRMILALNPYAYELI